jgi:hypothetical protein
MLLPKWGRPGKLAASRGQTFSSSPMARFVVLPTKGWSQTSDAEKLMGVCAWCMLPASAVVALALCGSSGECARQFHGEATAGKCAIASTGGWLRSHSRGADWSRRQHRRACIQLLRNQRIDVLLEPSSLASPATKLPPLSRAQRAHYRLSWQERLTRNARAPGASHVRLKLFGVPDAFATSLGLLTT